MPQPTPWWESRWLAAALVLLAAVPLLYPATPPLVDLLGHMGRYRVELDLAQSPTLQRYYEFDWTLSGNLGVDLLIVPLASLFGLEAAVRLIAIGIPMLTVAGLLWVAREVHGRIPPTSFFSIPLVYGHHFLFGFINYALGMAVALVSFALWLRLGRLGKLRLRTALFIPLSFIAFFIHVFAWGTLGLLCFSAEAVRQHDLGKTRWMAGISAAWASLALAGPLVLIVSWRHRESGGATADWFNWKGKQLWIESALRDRWRNYDRLSVLLLGVVLGATLFLKRLTFSRNLAFSTLLLVAVFVLLPRIIFGSAYADMRLVPFIIAIALIAIRFRGDTHLPTARLMAALGLIFLLVRLAGNTLSLGIAAQDQQAKLAALEHVPVGARVLSLVGKPCDSDWSLDRNAHLGAFVIIRRLGFSNDQWQLPGAALLTLRPGLDLGWFGSDPSQFVRDPQCADRDHHSVQWALASFPRDKFDYVWTIDPPAIDLTLLTHLDRVWNSAQSTLYRVQR